MLFRNVKDKYVEFHRFGNNLCERIGFKRYYKKSIKDIVREPLLLSENFDSNWLPKIEHLKRPIVGVQVRWGDHKPGDYKHFPTIPAKLKQVIKWPTVYLASDDLENVLPFFEDLNPETHKTLQLKHRRPEIADYWMLSKCDKLIGSNSSFFYAACLVNEICDEFYRPDNRDIMREFDPWSSPPCVKLDKELAGKNREEFKCLKKS